MLQTTLFKSLGVACWKVVGFSSRNYFHLVSNLISQIWDNMKIKGIRLRSRNSLSFQVRFLPKKLVILFAFILLQSRFFNSYGSIWQARNSLSRVRWNTKSKQSLTHWGRVTQICVFNTLLFSLHNTLNYAIHRACLRMVLLTDVYRNLTSLWINL